MVKAKKRGILRPRIKKSTTFVEVKNKIKSI